MWNFHIETASERIFSPDNVAEWVALYNQCDTHVFNHPLLIQTWIKTFSAVNHIIPIWIHGIDPDTNARSLWPFVLWRRNWKNAFLRVLMPAGGGDFDYHTPLIYPDANLNQYYTELIDFLQKNVKCDKICISGIPGSHLPATKMGWTQGEICPMLMLKDIPDVDTLMRFFKTSLRGDLRRQMRRLGEVGSLSMVEITSQDDVSTEFKSFMSAHTSRWPKAYKIPGFHRSLLSEPLLKSGIVSFTALRAGQTTVAWHLGFQDTNRFYYYMPAGNPEFAQYSPVKVHLLKLVERAISLNIPVYDHLRGEETYKSGWSNTAQHVNNLSIESRTESTKMKLNLLKLRHMITPPHNTLRISRLAA